MVACERRGLDLMAWKAPSNLLFLFIQRPNLSKANSLG